MYTNVDLQNKARYSQPVALSKTAIETATEYALSRIEKAVDKFGDQMCVPARGWYPGSDTGFSRNRYVPTERVTWTTGMWTGLCWLAYQLSGKEKFKEVAESHLKHYIKASQHPEGLDDHDTGFKFSPSCVAQYKMTGNKEARAAALEAARIQLEHYCPVNKFIIREGTNRPGDRPSKYRTLVDTMLNIPLFFWAYEETGDKAYYDAAVGHYRTTAKYLVREDGSSYHHYQFNPTTYEPEYGVTHQGNRNESCWTRGHSWLVYGYPVAYKYTKDAEIFDIHKAVSYYFMDHLPSDGVPYWDFDFTDGSLEARDSSASAVVACGLMEMCKYLPDTAEQKKYYQNAADLMLKALIEKCVPTEPDSDSLLTFVTGSVPHCEAINHCETYGDLFYFEALARKVKPDIEIFW
ncbi:MAG: glucoronyl hydrolase [Ruminococcaceae bacterium]|nr:glucoronyl hydrolase [Oscillospiraceae bacterium]